MCHFGRLVSNDLQRQVRSIQAQLDATELCTGNLYPAPMVSNRRKQSLLGDLVCTAGVCPACAIISSQYQQAMIGRFRCAWACQAACSGPVLPDAFDNAALALSACTGEDVFHHGCQSALGPSK